MDLQRGIPRTCDCGAATITQLLKLLLLKLLLLKRLLLKRLLLKRLLLKPSSSEASSSEASTSELSSFFSVISTQRRSCSLFFKLRKHCNCRVLDT
ncbi:BnaA02g17840D [Brassica napus]|uniref:BnaA02g17840D protein n=1 Tax=Brassica napus TaxID=3708 RepID=A0A078I9W1_BRANA|nr:BnaA02g17840D [Brassica napus]